jgi:GT2 family glycosyltransferase
VPAPVSIVIPSWNGRHLLEKFLPSVFGAAQHYLDHARADVEVIVVDDGSTDETAAWLRAWTATQVPLRVIRDETNRGFGAACNRGVRGAIHPLVLLVNNDVDVGTDLLLPLAACFDEEPADRPLFAVHALVRDFETGRDVGTGKMGGFARGFLRVHRSYITRDNARGPFWSMFASGGSAMFHRARFLELGGFDPLLAPFYFEDVELSYRAWKRGFSVTYEPRAVVRHRFSSTIGPLAGKRVEGISQRNRLMFHWVHLHDRRYLSSHLFWLTVLLVTAPMTLKWRFIGAFADAVRRLPAVGLRRRAEKAHSKRSDREVLQVFAEMESRTEIRAYDDPRELQR